MANRFNSNNGRATAPSASYTSPKASAPTPGTPMKTGPFKGGVGKSGPNRQAGFGTKIKQHTQDGGI